VKSQIETSLYYANDKFLNWLREAYSEGDIWFEYDHRTGIIETDWRYDPNMLHEEWKRLKIIETYNVA